MSLEVNNLKVVCLECGMCNEVSTFIWRPGISSYVVAKCYMCHKEFAFRTVTSIRVETEKIGGK